MESIGMKKKQLFKFIQICQAIDGVIYFMAIVMS